MLVKTVFIIIGLIVGLLQYGLIKMLAKYTAEKRSGAIGIIAIKLLLYAISATTVLLWFKDNVFLFAAGVASGLLVTAITDALRNKKQ